MTGDARGLVVDRPEPVTARALRVGGQPFPREELSPPYQDSFVRLIIAGPGDTRQNDTEAGK